MEIQVQHYLDDDGFFRRECPTCEREFKWFYGETEGRPEDFLDPENYFCPYCGVPSGKDTWWTQAQLQYAQAAAMGPIARQLKQELGRSFKISINAQEVPLPVVDPNDMVMVEPPCHKFEPLKVSEEWQEPLHCLICGSQFRI